MIVINNKKIREPLGKVVRKKISTLLTFVGMISLVLAFIVYIFALFDNSMPLRNTFYVNLFVSIVAVSREILSKWSKDSLKMLVFIVLNLILFNPFLPIYWGSVGSLMVLVCLFYSLSIYFKLLGVDENVN